MWEGLIDGAATRHTVARRRKAAAVLCYAIESLECRRLLTRFAVIGDMALTQSGVLSSVATMVKGWNPAHIVTVGDNNNTSGQDTNFEATVGEYFHEWISPYLGSRGAGSTTGNKFWPAMGNHDWESSQGSAPYTNYFTLPGKERYYNIKLGDVEFFMLDSDTREPDGTSSTSTQGNWLRNALAASTAQWQIVIDHHPPYSSAGSSDATWMRWPFKDWGADALISGHHHLYERLNVGGMPYFINATAGATIGGFGTTDSNSQFRYNAEAGAMQIDSSSSALAFRFYNRSGSLIDSYTVNATTPPPTGTPVTLIPTNAPWKYLDNGTNQGTAWRASSFVDSTWKTGNAELGYGDGDEATVVSFGPSSTSKFITTYFRKAFSVADAAAMTSLNLKLLRDDGAVVYLNGNEIYRNNMPSGTISSSTLASSTAEDDNTYFTATINPALLVNGNNVIAVEIHQSVADSSDISFNFELSGTSSTSQTPTTPAAPGNLAATAASSTQINLAWQDNSNNENGFRIERSPNGTTGWTEIATTSAAATTYQDTTVAASTQYWYRVRAFNGAGDSGNSNVANTTTPAAPLPPAAPGSLAASAASSVQINLTWADLSSDETGFKVERSLDGINGWTQIGTTLAGVTSYADGARTANTTYWYRVRATNTAGDSDYSNIDSATTPNTPPPPQNVNYIVAGNTWKYLDNGTNQGTAWRAPAFSDATWKNGASELGYGDGDEATLVGFGTSSSNKFITTYFRKTFTIADPAAVSALAYRLLRDDGAVVYLNGVEVLRSNMPTGTITNTTRASAGVNGNAERQWFTGSINPALLVAGTNVIAVEIHQESPSSSDVSFNFELTGTATATPPPDEEAPAAPSGAGASALSESEIRVTWIDTADNETGFRVERSTNGVDFAPLGNTNAGTTSYNDTTVAASTQYWYRIFAFNAVGDSPASSTASATTPAPAPPPAAPGTLVATAASSTQINLAWQDLSSNETGFKIERSLNGTSGWTQIATVGTGVTIFQDGGRAANTTYWYRVRATNTAGDSDYSNIASATTQPTSGPSNVTVITANSTWRYLDNGSNQGTAWRAPAFSDATWKNGASELGYGDGDEATVVSFGPSSGAKYITTYFRQAFNIADPAAVSALAMRLIRDDGAVVYLNGVEVYRNNLPTGTIAYNTLASGTASGTAETTWLTANLNPALLVAGTNVIAVEIHQDRADSSDLSMKMELTATISAPTSASASSVTAPSTNSAATIFSRSLIGDLEDEPALLV
jgi:hypothetical protein